MAFSLQSNAHSLGIHNTQSAHVHSSLSAYTTLQEQPYPVVIVPGTGGNQVEARLTADYKPSGLFCRRWLWEKDWFTIWFDLSVIVPPFTECFAERMSLVYDSHEDEYINAPGVETRVPYFGSTKGMQYLDPKFKTITPYMSLLVKSLEDAGYIDGKSLLGAPYDFRYGPGTKPSSVGRKYLRDLQKLVEEAYTSNGDTQVILVSHSLGGLWALYLLNQQPLSWRQQYIKHFVAIAAPWGGTVQEMRTFASGYSLDIPTVNPLVVRAEQRSSESNLWLLPVPEVFGNDTLVTTEQKSYSALDMPEFLKDIGFSEGIYPYKSHIRPLTEHLKAPKVPVTLIFGTGIDTPETLIYNKGGFDNQPEIIMGDGDGTVNLCSLSAVVSNWSATEGQKLMVVKIPQCTHTTILKDEESIQKIVDVILGANLQSTHSAVT
ncbi:hypothetical protein SUGI_0558430 [Cryptomeria japonica]|nr:hypothetical protein SUGI_0558430 [Cryptomeria japonica]